MSTNTQTPDDENRRPLKVRQAGFANRCAVWLSGRDITPNQISIASVGFAVLAAICLLCIPGDDGPSVFLPIMAAIFIQCRLLCNLFDGMVAIEGGKGTAAGELFNDIPDRIADPLILISAGYAVVNSAWAVELGWTAGVLAVMTAYVRTLAASIGAPVDFGGPMAKQHRMAAMSIACVLSAFEAYFWSSNNTMLWALFLIVLGCVVTVIKRSYRAYHCLENQAQDAT